MGCFAISACLDVHTACANCASSHCARRRLCGRRLWHLLLCQAEWNAVSCKKCELERRCSLVWLGCRTPAQNDALNTCRNKLHECYTLRAFCQSIGCQLHLFGMHILLLLLRCILSILFCFFWGCSFVVCVCTCTVVNMYTTLPPLSYGGDMGLQDIF